MTSVTDEIRERIDELDWPQLSAQLDEHGHAVTGALLTASECADLAALFEIGRFRATIDMARHRFGDGRYRYFDHSLPETVAAVRSGFHRHLAPIANDWAARMRGENPTFPLEHGASRALCGCRPAASDAADPALRRW
jgi:hypothetical protein